MTFYFLGPFLIGELYRKADLVFCDRSGKCPWIFIFIYNLSLELVFRSPQQ